MANELRIFKKRADYPNDFEFIKDNGELVYSNGKNSSLLFQNGEFIIFEGTSFYKDFASFLGLKAVISYSFSVGCIVKRDGQWNDEIIDKDFFCTLVGMIRDRDKRGTPSA